MKRFRTVLVNGYQKSEVDRYIDALTEEAEKYEEEMNHELEKKQELIQDLQNEVKELEERETSWKQEKAILEEKVKACCEAETKQAEFDAERLRQMEEKLKEYEANYKTLADVLADARLEASRILSEARTEAEALTQEAQCKAERTTLEAQEDTERMIHTAKQDAEIIISTARNEAEEYREKTEEDMRRKREEDIGRFELARKNLADYLDSLNCSQSKLVETYNELGVLVERMPLRVADVFSDLPYQLLAEEKEKERKVTEVENENRK